MLGIFFNIERINGMKNIKDIQYDPTKSFPIYFKCTFVNTMLMYLQISFGM